MFRKQLPRIYELKDLLDDPPAPDAHFLEFDTLLQNPSRLAAFVPWEREFQGLDDAAWASLKGEAAS